MKDMSNRKMSTIVGLAAVLFTDKTAINQERVNMSDEKDATKKTYFK